MRGKPHVHCLGLNMNTIFTLLHSYRWEKWDPKSLKDFARILMTLAPCKCSSHYTY
jgi:hypothetical protein